MDQNRLHALLAELDRELKSAGSLDARSQQLLERVLSDIRQVEGPADAQADLGAHRSAEARLRELVLRFETDHPQLSGAMGQLADALGKLGI